MDNYKIFENKNGATIKVKEGWSWPAFFFTIIWAAIKELWTPFIYTLLIWIPFLILTFNINTDLDTISIIQFTGSLIIAIIFGASGNDWLVLQLKKKGFTEVGKSTKSQGKERLQKKEKNQNEMNIIALSVLIDSLSEQEMKSLPKRLEKYRDKINSDSFLNKLGYTYLRNGDLPKAKILFETNLKYFPEFANVYASYGDYLFETKEFPESKKYYQEALEKLSFSDQKDDDYHKKLLNCIMSRLLDIDKMKEKPV